MIQRRSLSLAVLVLSAAAHLAGPALAQNLDAIKTRQALMKDNGKAAGEAGAILKGEAEFSPDKATAIFTRMHDVAVKFGDHFPEDSKTGGETEAAPAIWEEPEEFEAALVKYQEDTQAAIDSAPQDVAAFQQAFGQVAQNCRGCHEDFRIDTD
ncbi:cytochrome c [Aurantimonas sp. 22II-16-19i]|uniref:c-type cytochrome n=1 Tax=Aurantimonas sp. 22II-16-19i TaxID=1317114 RepID=UPI0009F7E5AF|nr:cytochrome c [Aurantimonas sp. 22II-16-19i]ORE91468.1 cytochrome c prime [Aurantimonas sp. 22II-16-19i]